MAATTQDVIMLVGDSLTQGGWEPHGFAQKLAYVYARKFDVINRGWSGYNTEWAIPVFEQCFAQQHERLLVPRVRLLVFWFGANDACIKPSPQHVPLPDFSANLKRLIQMITTPTSAWYSPETRILLMTPPPINTFQRKADLDARDPPLALDREFDVTAQYAQAVRDVGGAERVPVVDVFSALWAAVGHDEKALEKYFTDGLHLTADGYAIVYDELIKTIGDEYPNLHPDKLQPVFTPWSEVDWKNPRETSKKRNAVLE